MVAGTNYFFVIEFKIKQRHTLYEIMVYEDFQGALSLVKKRKISVDTGSSMPMVPGGFVNQKLSDAGTIRVANKVAGLVQKKYRDHKFLGLLKAATQVVAGTNYFFVMKFQAKNQVFLYEILVYEDLQGHLTLDKVKRIKTMEKNRQFPSWHSRRLCKTRCKGAVYFKGGPCSS